MRVLFCLLVLASAAQGEEGAIGSGVLPEIQAPSQLESPELPAAAATTPGAGSIQRPLTQPVTRTLGGAAMAPVAPVAGHHHHTGAGCSQCQGGQGSSSQALRNYSNEGCQANVCQQAAAAGYSIGCCDQNMTPYFALWADYCTENQPAAAPACGPAGCQTRNWGRGANTCNSCGASCKLAMLKAKLFSRPHLPNVWTRSVVSDGSCYGGDGCQGEVVSGGYVGEGVLDVAPNPAYSQAAPLAPAQSLQRAPGLPTPPTAAPVGAANPAAQAPNSTAPVGLPYSRPAVPPITPAPQIPVPDLLQNSNEPAGAAGDADSGTPAAPDVDLLESSYIPGPGRGQQMPYGWKPQAAQLPPAAPAGAGSGWNRFRGKF